jgi:site-specific DNA-methyltransferase (adenine-specific)
LWAPNEWCAEAKVFCTEKLGLHLRSWIIWAFTFGVANQKNFSRSHTHILYLSKTAKGFTFNDGEVRVPSARKLIYKDKRQNPNGKLPDATWMLLREQMEPYMGGDVDTWMKSRICGTFGERRRHISNQIPLPLYERIIQVASNRGDLVVDPFGGSFGSGEMAVRLKRNYIGFDISQAYCEAGIKRLESLS